MSNLRMRSLVGVGVELAVTEPVIMEVLAGVTNDAREAELSRLLATFTMLPVDPQIDYAAAARIYRRCRRTGITPRGLVDCLITAVAWRERATLLAFDVDLARIADVVGVDMDQASHPG